MFFTYCELGYGNNFPAIYCIIWIVIERVYLFTLALSACLPTCESYHSIIIFVTLGFFLALYNLQATIGDVTGKQK